MVQGRLRGSSQFSSERKTLELLNFDYVIEKFVTLKPGKINF